MLKPEFWGDTKTGQLSIEAQLTFIGLLNIADDRGNLRADPRLIKATLFPYKPEISIESALSELIKVELVMPYEVRGQSYLSIVNFLKHQTINRPSVKLFLPHPSESNQFNNLDCLNKNTHGVLTEHSLSTHGALSEPSLSPHAKKKRREKKITSNKGLFEETVDLTKAWNEKVNAALSRVERLTDKRQAAMKRFLKSHTEDDWERIIAEINASDFLLGRGGQTWKASFDWAINVNNAVKVLEGNYRNTQAIQTVQGIPVLKRFDQPMTSKEKAALLLQTKDNHATTENR